MAIPGTPGTVYTADGLEHTEGAIPSSQARDHGIQLDKRERKLMRHDYGSRWADVEGDGKLAVITFGSATGPVREAVQRAARAGRRRCGWWCCACWRRCSPKRCDAALAGVERVMVIEQNHGAQLLRYLRGMVDLPAGRRVSTGPGPLPLRPGDVCEAILEWAGKAVARKEAV